MMDGRRILRNFLSLTAAQVVGFVCGLATTIVLARNLGPDSFGILGFGQAFIGFAGIAVVLGTDTYGTREIARDRTCVGPLVGEILGLRIVLAALVIPALVGVAFAVGHGGVVTRVLSLQALGLIGTVVILDFVFQGVQQMGAIAVRQTIAPLLVVAGAATLVHGPGDVYIAALLPPVAVLSTSLWLMRRMHRHIAPLRVRFDRRAWAGWIRAALPIGLGGLSITVFQYTDVLMLGFAVPQADVGRYVALGRLYIVVVSVGNLLVAVFAPVLAQLGTAEIGARRAAYRHFAVSVLVLAGPAASLLAVFPGDAVRLFFGAGYTTDPAVLSIIMLSAVAFTVTAATSAALVAWDDQLFHAKALGTAAAANVALNALLIPHYGLWGAAAATLVSLLALVAVEVRRLARRHDIAQLGLLVTVTGLLAVVFGLAYVVRQAVALPLLDRSPLATLVLFGGGAGVIFLGLTAAIGLVEPARLFRLVRRA